MTAVPRSQRGPQVMGNVRVLPFQPITALRRAAFVTSHGLSRRGDRIAGLLLVVGAISALFASACVWFIANGLTTVMLAQVSARARDQLQLGMLGRLSPADFLPPHLASSLADISARLDPIAEQLHANDSGTLRFKLIAVDGTVIYSDDVRARGELVPPAAKPELAAAPAGATGSAGSTGDSSTSTGESPNSRTNPADALAVFVPLIMDGQVVGTYELDQDRASLQDQLQLIWVVLTTAFAIVLGVATGWTATRFPARRGVDASVSPPADPTPTAGQKSELTPRELEVLRLMATAGSYREIASTMVISEETVRTHAKRVLRKLGQPHRTQAVMQALATGILTMPDGSNGPDGSAHHPIG